MLPDYSNALKQFDTNIASYIAPEPCIIIFKRLNRLNGIVTINQETVYTPAVSTTQDVSGLTFFLATEDTIKTEKFSMCIAKAYGLKFL